MSECFEDAKAFPLPRLCEERRDVRLIPRLWIAALRSRRLDLYLPWQTAPVSPYSLMVGWQRSCSVDTHVRLDHQH